MENLIIFVRCFWFNYMTRMSPLFLGLGIVSLILNFPFLLKGIFIICFMASFYLPAFGLSTFRAYKKYYRFLKNHNCINPMDRTYCAYVGTGLAIKDFYKEFPDLKMTKRAIKKFKDPVTI